MTKQKHFLVSLFVVCFAATSSEAFTVPRPAASTSSSFGGVVSSHLSAASMESETSESSSAVATAEGSELSWEETLQTPLMQEVRIELINKYLDNGVSQEVAEEEVTIFLNDRERSEKYLEMRTYAQAQADDLGIGFGLQLFGGFMVGFLGMTAPKYIAAYKQVYPDGNGPIPFL